MRYTVICMVLLAVLSLAGCAVTKVTFGPDGALTSISHSRFIIDEEHNNIRSGSDYLPHNALQ